jgi:hypothetical protein
MQHLPYLRAITGRRPFAYICPPNGQSAEDRAKPSPPSRSPLNLSPGRKSPWPNGFSRRTRLSHEILPSTMHARAWSTPNTKHQHPAPTSSSGFGCRAPRVASCPGAGAGVGVGSTKCGMPNVLGSELGPFKAARGSFPRPATSVASARRSYMLDPRRMSPGPHVEK